MTGKSPRHKTRLPCCMPAPFAALFLAVLLIHPANVVVLVVAGGFAIVSLVIAAVASWIVHPLSVPGVPATESGAVSPVGVGSAGQPPELSSTQVSSDTPVDAGAVAPVRVCERCGTLLEGRVSTCPACGAGTGITS